jgi:hypothetical protein
MVIAAITIHDPHLTSPFQGEELKRPHPPPVRGRAKEGVESLS